MSHQQLPKTASGNNERPEVDLEAFERLRSALDECEARYERLVENSPDVIYRARFRPDIAFEYINSAAERMLGYSREAFLKGGYEFMQGLMVEAEDQSDSAEIIAGRRYYSAVLRRYRRSDGAVIWAELHNTPVYDASGTLVAQEGTVRDVTEREQALIDLGASEQQMRVLMEALPDLILRVDDTGTFTEHIPTASKQPARLFVGKTMSEMLPPESRALAAGALQDALAGTTRVFRSWISMYGDQRSYEFCLVSTAAGGLLALMRDVTDEEWAAGEEERREARARLEHTVDQQIGIRNPYELTFREFTVLHLVARGAADKEIAIELGIAPSTVHKHVSNILGKMSAGSRTEATMRAVQEGLVSV